MQLDVVPVVPVVPLVLPIDQGKLDGNDGHTDNKRTERRQHRSSDLPIEILKPAKDSVELDRRDLVHNMLKLFDKGPLDQLWQERNQKRTRPT